MRNDTPRFKPLALALAASLFVLSAQAEEPAAKKAELKLQAGTASSVNSQAAAAAAAKAAAKDNATKVPGNASPAVPGVDTGRKDVDIGKPGGSKTDATNAISSPATAARADLAGQVNTGITNKPGFEQGLGQKQVSSEALKAAAAAAGLGGNPVSSLTGTSADGAGLTGIGAQGKGAISEAPSGTNPVGSDQGTITLPSGEVIAPGRSTKDADELAARHGVSSKGVMGAYSSAGNSQIGCALDETKCGGPDTVKAGKTAAKEDAIVHTRSDGSRTTTVKHSDGSFDIYTRDANGKLTGVESYDKNNKKDEDREKALKEEEEKKVAEAKAAKEKAEKEKAAKEGKSGVPTEEARFQPGKQEFLNGKLNDRNFQIKEAAKQGGAVNPDRGDSAAGVAVSGAVVPSQSAIGQNLFGNPGQSGGLREGGAPQGGLDFNDKKFGAIDLGPDQTNTAGNRQQDAGDFFGGSQPSQGLPPRNSQDCDRDRRTADTSDDCPTP